MASLARAARPPTCLQCLRRISYGEFNEVKFATGSMLHTRGKKVKTIQGPKETVLLLKPMKGIGRIGDLVSIEIKHMNRVWIPHRIATRLTADEMRAHLAKTAVVQTPEPKEEEQIQPVSVAPVAPIALVVKPELLSPSMIKSILEKAVPTMIKQYRKLIENRAPENPAEIKTDDASADFLTAKLDDNKEAYDALASKRAAVPGQDIHGSITNQDLRNEILERLAKDPQTSRVVLNTQDIKILEGEYTLRSGHKIYRTGEYPFTITITGVKEPIRRTVVVEGLAAKHEAQAGSIRTEAVGEIPQIPIPADQSSSSTIIKRFVARPPRNPVA